MTCSSPLSLSSPGNPPSQRPMKLGSFLGVEGEVGEIPCIRKLDTKFSYIGILYIC